MSNSIQTILKVIFFCFFYTYSLPVFSKIVVRSIKDAENNKIIFSNQPGFFDKEISLSYKADLPTRFIYTIDGNIPEKGGAYLPENFRISSNTALSLRLVRDNQITDTVFCGTYLIGFKSTLPITTLIVPPGLFTDPPKGIYIGGSDALSKGRWGNCWTDKEVPALFELFTSENQIAIAQFCALEIHGDFTRGNPEKSLKLTAKKKFGEGKFKYKVFKNKNISSFNSLILRVSGSDYNATRFLDMLCSSLGRDMGIDYMAFEPSVLFVNGVYWGIHNIREKIDLNYLETNHNADSSKTDLLCDHIEVKLGNKKAYQNLFKFFDSIKSNDKKFIPEAEKRMDIQEYFNYIILQTHIINVDSRGNVKYWRAGNTDNKFHWILYDCDLSFASPNLNYLSKRLSASQTEWYNPNYTTFLLRKLTANEHLRQQFINQYCYLLSTHLSNDSIQNRISYFRNLLSPEIPRHVKRKKFNESVTGWEKQITRLRKFSDERAKTSIEHLQACFKLNKKYRLSIQNNIKNKKLNICINQNKLSSDLFNGVFFTEIPLLISADTTNPLFVFEGWSDGIKDRKRLIAGVNSGVIELTANYEPIQKSASFGLWKFRCINPGKKKEHPWIYLNNNEATDLPELDLIISGKEKGYTIPNAAEYKEIVVVKDSTSWRNTHITFKGLILEDKTLNLKDPSILFILKDASGKLIDSVGYTIPESQQQSGTPLFLVRDGDQLVPSVREILNEGEVQHMQKKQQRFHFNTITLSLLLLMLLTLFGLLTLSRHLSSKKKSF
jgi:hypothetical protein